MADPDEKALDVAPLNDAEEKHLRNCLRSHGDATRFWPKDLARLFATLDAARRELAFVREHGQDEARFIAMHARAVRAEAERDAAEARSLGVEVLREAAQRAMAHRKRAESDGAASIAYHYCAVEYLDEILAALEKAREAGPPVDVEAETVRRISAWIRDRELGEPDTVTAMQILRGDWKGEG